MTDPARIPTAAELREHDDARQRGMMLVAFEDRRSVRTRTPMSRFLDRLWIRRRLTVEWRDPVLARMHQEGTL